IDYVEASPPDSELVSLEEVKDFDPEDGEIDTNILLTIKDDILCEKLLNINLFIAKIKALKDNPTPSTDSVLKSPSLFPNSFLEETDTFDNSLPESEIFCFDMEEKRVIPIYYDDDDDEESFTPLRDIIISELPPCIAITLILSVEEPADSLIMKDEHLDTIPKTESNEVIKSNIDYVEASPPDSELVSLEEVKDFDPEDGEIDTNILLRIKDDILREKLLNINLFIAKIKALKDNPTPSTDYVLKSPSSFPNSFLEETDTFDNSLPESEIFCFDMEEKRV
nr:hypothetical protein [Tanacetum cinerariifolium]